ncbi:MULTISPECIES: DUF3515 domain-containing protein [unclassified Dietzia]|uniref:DUF3515 domain-containing protein n=1 Tax=unclassified Dietzia TaxID=2617939 RepID=UPI000D225D5D|nr:MULTISPECIES: DUF3515 domain-containing protein [unclassified Dietzia]AVZ39639.1 DUF3515 domain-containing protein [Dietzia sp. JS16-p6b]MBB1024288.1 DUF3515 domain-containing protein [Dietzia sp. DQ12-76]MBB1027433.1 DUF3515 domain-containing protein [Dietzia sp. DQ11-38-2]QGW24949.1 hypothetical protein GJR88_02966 [Dietzia sp. DQ12-45-1b]
MRTTETNSGDRHDARSSGSSGPAASQDLTPDGGHRPPVSTVVVIAAVLIPLVLLAVVLVLVRSMSDEAAETAASEPVTAVSIPAPGAGSEECLSLLESLPESLGEADRVPFVEPAPPGAAAYRLPDAETVVVRCGLPAPPTFTVGSTLQEVNGVQWFNDPDPDPAVTSSTWVAVDRPEYIAVTLPATGGTGPIQDLSDALSAVLEAVEPRPAPIS